MRKGKATSVYQIVTDRIRTSPDSAGAPPGQAGVGGLAKSVKGEPHPQSTSFQTINKQLMTTRRGFLL